MIKKTAKGITALFIAYFFVFLTLFGWGDYSYPDTVSCWSGEEVEEVFALSLPPGESPRKTVYALGFLPVKEVSVRYYEKNEVIPGGDLFGVRMDLRGLLVTDLGEVTTESGKVNPGEKAGLCKGDLILSANGVDLTSASTLAKCITKSEGSPLELCVEREGKKLSLTLTPALSSDGGGYRAGLWVRDGAAGLGTVTFQDPVSGAFGGLGHAVCNGETGVAFPLSSGQVCSCRVDGIVKGEDGKPGEIRGHLETASCGTLAANTECGVFGTFSAPSQSKTVPLGLKEELQTGEATILCTLDEEGKKEYTIRIEEILDRERSTKNFIIQVTDPALLEKTGGIVQGMSGSPILQNGKLVGAVTHVLIHDPTRGYGIFIENMLENMPK